jgi:hypothetical protein
MGQLADILRDNLRELALSDARRLREIDKLLKESDELLAESRSLRSRNK